MPGALLLYAPTQSQLGAVYVPRDSIRNAALVWKLRLGIITGDVKKAPNFNRIVHMNLNIQTVSSLDLLTHLLVNLLHRISWKFTNGTLTVFPPKLLEFPDRLINSDINILTVQESKLQKADKTPFIEGYATIWKDRNNILGGRLLLFIQTDIVFQKLHFSQKLVSRSCLFASRLLNQLRLNFIMYFYETPQLSITNSTLL